MKLFAKKCCFCKSHKGFFHSVGQYGIYSECDKRYFYHPDCLEKVQIDPESHDMRLVDMAIHILDMKERNLKDREAYIENIRKRKEELKSKINDK